MPDMFSVERKVGRLVEVVIRDSFPLEEVEGMIRLVRLEFLSSSEGVVLCAIFDGVKFVHPDAAAPLVEMLKRDNPKLVRAGYRINQRFGTFAMFIDRVVREAKNPQRRWFDNSAELRGFLGEVLTKPEATRLDELLEKI
ncbi:MAG: hypothetical protein U0165_11475 [Polyangiaceae bacterium]